MRAPVEAQQSATEGQKVGLQHAIHDVREDSHSESTPKKGVGRSGLAGGMKRASSRLALRFSSFLRAGGSERMSVWRVLALAIVVYVVALNLANFAVVRPLREKLDDLVAQKSVVEDFLILRQSGQAVAGVRDALMRGDERVTALGDIREMARESGLAIVGDATLLAPTETSDRMTEYPVEITLEGSYHEVGEFLRRLESSHRLLAVHEVGIDASETSASRAEVNVLVGVLSWEE